MIWMKPEGLRQQSPKELQTNSYRKKKNKHEGLLACFLCSFTHTASLAEKIVLQAAQALLPHTAFPASLRAVNDLPTVLGSLAA